MVDKDRLFTLSVIRVSLSALTSWLGDIRASGLQGTSATYPQRFASRTRSERKPRRNWAEPTNPGSPGKPPLKRRYAARMLLGLLYITLTNEFTATDIF